MRIEISNFGNHARLAFEWSAQTLMVVGQNRVGKTCLRDAIEFALLGTCTLRGFHLKKDVARYMIHEAADRASVEIRFGTWGVRRTMKSTGAQKVEIDRNGNGGWVECSAADWSDAFPHDPDVVRCALESDFFWRAPAETRSAWLVKLCGDSALTVGRVRSVLEEHVGNAYASNPNNIQTLLEYAQRAVEDGFESANAAAVEARRALKRQRDQIDTQEGFPDDHWIVDGVDVRGQTLEDLFGKMGRAQDRERKAQAAANLDRGRLEGALDAARSRKAAADKRWGDLSRQIWREFAKDGDNEDGSPTDTFSSQDFLEDAAIAEAQLEALRVENIRSLTAAAEMVREIDALQVPEPAEVAGPPDQCPHVPFKMKCPAPKARFLEARKAADGQIQAARDAAAARTKELVEEREQTLRDVAKRSERIDKLADEIAELQRKGRRRAELDRDNRAAKAEVDVAEVEIAKATEKLEQAMAAPSGEDIEQVSQEARIWEAVMARAREHATWSARIQKAASDVAKLDDGIGFMDALERALRPDGAEAQIAADASEGLRGHMRDGDAHFGEITLSPDFDVTIGGRHIAAASKSEQRCAGMVMQYAIARVIGLPLFVVDELDSLDQEWRRAYLGFARSIGGRGVRLIGLATTNSSPPAAPPPGFQTLWLRDDGADLINPMEVDDGR